MFAALAIFPSSAEARGLCLILIGCTPDAPAVSPPPPPANSCPPQPRRGTGSFVGIVTEDIYWDASAYRRCALNDKVSSGVDLLRQTFDWSQIEIARGVFDFSWHDKLMVELARRRLRVLPILFNAPRFRSTRRNHRGRGAHLPRRYEDMGRFAGKLVRRYGPRGRF